MLLFLAMSLVSLAAFETHVTSFAIEFATWQLPTCSEFLWGYVVSLRVSIVISIPGVFVCRQLYTVGVSSDPDSIYTVRKDSHP